MPYVLIDPQEKLDYTCDWSTFLDDGGSPSDTISASSWEIAPLNAGSPTEPVLSGEISTTNSTTVFVANCRAGEIYHLSNRVETAAGRIAERSVILRCDHR